MLPARAGTILQQAKEEVYPELVNYRAEELRALNDKLDSILFADPEYMRALNEIQDFEQLGSLPEIIAPELAHEIALVKQDIGRKQNLFFFEVNNELLQYITEVLLGMMEAKRIVSPYSISNEEIEDLTDNVADKLRKKMFS